jgi:hypothetical protein
MAKTSNAWDLSDGMDVDYSGSKEVAASDKSFREAQAIIDKAYDLDREGETQQGIIDVTNAKNQDLLADYTAKSELEKALQAAEGYASESQPEEITPEKRELVGYAEQNIDGQDVQVPQYKVTPEQRTPAIATQRPRTQLERLRAALPALTSPRARSVAQEAIRKEITNQAYQLHAFEPDQALKMLRENGLGVATSLERSGDGTFKQVLSDGQIKTYSQLDASAMVGDIIKGTNELQKVLMARQKQAADEARQTQKDNASENRADARNERVLAVERLKLFGKLGAGRYGRTVGFDEDGNPVIGGGMVGSGSNAGRGGGGGAIAADKNTLVAGIKGEPSRPASATPNFDFSKLNYEQAFALQQTAALKVSQYDKDRTGAAYILAAQSFAELEPIVQKLKNKKQQANSGGIDPLVAPGDRPAQKEGQGSKEYMVLLKEWGTKKIAHDDYIAKEKAKKEHNARNIRLGISQ